MPSLDTIHLSFRGGPRKPIGWPALGRYTTAGSGRLTSRVNFAGCRVAVDRGPDVASALMDDLNVPGALALAKEAGGQVLRELVGLLGLH